MMEFGDKAKDIVTGFEGIVMGRCKYATGCDQVLLTGGLDKESGKPIGSIWYDIDRIMVTKAKAIQFSSGDVVTPRRMTRRAAGGDLPAPTK